MTDWHGYSVNEVSYFVTKHPARKSITLLRQDGSVAQAAAYFRTEEHARMFLAWLDELAQR